MRNLIPVLAMLSLHASLALAADPPAAPAPAACPEGTAERTVHTLLFAGNPAGSQTACLLKDGSREYFFAYNDRGRGPDLHTRLRLDAQGLQQTLATTGNDYLKSAIDEHFTRDAKGSRWKNKIEQGESASTASAFYLSQSSVPEEMALLAHVLQSAPGMRLALLPQGEARIAQWAERTVSAGGESRRLRLVAIEGLGFEPTLLWLEDDDRLFAQIEPWSQLFPEGWQDSVAALQKVQDAELDSRRKATAERLQRRPAAGFAIEHALLFDSAATRMRPGMTVVVEGNTIRAVGADGTVAIPPGAERIDARGRALLPGLWDMHTHPGAGDGALLLAAGITAVRDMAAEPEKRAQLAPFDSGEALGPRVVFAGIIDGKGPFHGPTRMLVENDAEARAAVREIADARFRQVKIYSSVKPELVPVIVDEAHRRGLRVSGHIPAYMTAQQAVLAGYDEIQHMNMLFLNFLYDEVQDTRTPARFTAVAAHAAEIDPDSPRVREFIALLKEHHVTLDPTLVAFEGLYCDRPGTVESAFAADAARLPPLVRRGLLEGGLPVPEGQDARYREAFRQMQRMLLALYRADLSLVAGTDAPYGLALVRELELWVEAGIPAPVVLGIATRHAAEVAGEGERLGQLTPGRLADLVLVDGDPSRNIADLRRLRLVVKDGALIDLEGLWRELGIAPPQGAGP